MIDKKPSSEELKNFAKTSGMMTYSSMCNRNITGHDIVEYIETLESRCISLAMAVATKIEKGEL